MILASVIVIGVIVVPLTYWFDGVIAMGFLTGIVSLMMGVAGGLFFGFCWGLFKGLTKGLFTGCAWGLIWGLLLGLVGGLTLGITGEAIKAGADRDLIKSLVPVPIQMVLVVLSGVPFGFGIGGLGFLKSLCLYGRHLSQDSS